MNWPRQGFARHDSRAVMACVKKNWSDILDKNVIIMKLFHWIWILVEKVLVKWVPEQSGNHFADEIFVCILWKRKYFCFDSIFTNVYS